MDLSPVRFSHRRFAGVSVVAVLVAAGVFGVSGAAFAASPVVEVLPTTLAATGWNQIYTGGTGVYDFVDAADAPLGTGALLLSTPLGPDYVQFGRTLGAPVPVSSAAFSYASKRLTGPAHAAPGVLLALDLHDPNFITGLWAMYEPIYQHPVNDGANYDVWNTWQITSDSSFWFMGDYDGNFFNGATGDYATLDQILLKFPDAEITDLYLNMGTGNNGWSALVDAVDDMTSTSNFERVTAPAPVPAAAPAADSGSAAGRSLPSTGAHSMPIAIGGIALLALGAVFFGAATKRRKVLVE